MAMGRNLRVSHNLPNVGPNQSYSLIMEQRGRDEILLVENYAIVPLCPIEYEGIKKQYVKHTDAHGCLGILRINEGAVGAGEHVLYFLVLVTGCSSVGKIGSCEIYRLSNLSMVSMRGYPYDEDKVGEIKKLLCCGTFYFSWGGGGGGGGGQQEQAPTATTAPLDLTLAAQKAMKPNTKTDNRFFWNRMLHIPFIRHGINTEEWLLKVMCGSVEVRTVYVGSKQAKAVVISRLSSERAGTRFQVRGVDDFGYVANFAETEQAIYLGEEITSMVQIRGSVPLFWDQPGVNVGSHKIRMSRGPELCIAAFDQHLRQLKENYGNQVIVNLLGASLVGSKEGEATLSTAFQTHHKACEHHLDIPHILFDYHAEVKGGNEKDLAKLKGKIQKYVEKFGFYYSKEDNVVREQFGTVRSNCTDCLDRTNSVQTFIGLEVLGYMLSDLCLSDKPNVVSRFQELFKQMWLSNGNELSKMYAGTGALGQGGGGGATKLIDGARSAARTIQNNLLDSTKQEAIEVLLFGSSFNSDLADRARVLLPPHYINAPRPILENLVDRYLDYSEPVPLRVAIGTYNINGGKHFRSIVYKDVSLSDWLLDAHKTDDVCVDLGDSMTDGRKPIDIYAIGFEEMVDLDAKNIMNASSDNAKQWAQELTKILNRDEKFSLITYQQLVGVCLYVFVRPELAPHIRDVGVDSVKTGLGGATGNKGAVAIRLRYHSTSVCFVCSHFAAGQNNVADRNNDFGEAVKRIMFPKGRTLLSHDYVFWCGDFNYRINLPRDEVKSLVQAQDYEGLLSADQLSIEHSTGNVFADFHEAPIDFAPTYKYDLFSDDYDTSEKCRAPAWTDRVLWRRRPLHLKNQPLPSGWSAGSCLWYGRAELKQSDHRPILAVIDVEVLRVNEGSREEVFTEAMKGIGPPDGSIMLQFDGVVNFDVQTVFDDHFMTSLVEQLETVGKIRFTKFVNDMVWVAFMDHAKALEAAELGSIQVFGHVLSIQLKHPDWRELLAKELDLCSSTTVKLCGNKDLNLKRDSARLLSKLSQLSFEELEDITLASAGSSGVGEAAGGGTPPPKPPPPRPAPPPSSAAASTASPPPARPGPPPARPVQPPARPAPPPARPAPPPSRPTPKPDSIDTSKSNSTEKSGFSDIFGLTSPIESDLPISLSSGSLVCLAGPEPPGLPGSGIRRSSSPKSPEDQEMDDDDELVNGNDEAMPDNASCTSPPPPLPSVSAPASSSSNPDTPKKLAPKRAGGAPPPPPSRPLPGPPPAGAPPTGPPPSGPPPALPGRPSAGPPPPVPKR